MNPGSIFFDQDFRFADGETGEKLFVVLGSKDALYVVVKTTTKQHGRGLDYGCQPRDRFYNFFLPTGCCYLKSSSWVCLNEFYELKQNSVLQKKFSGSVRHICNLDDTITRALQECALNSLDISNFQAEAIQDSIVTLPSANTPPTPGSQGAP